MCSLPTNGPPKPPSPQFIGGSSSGLAELRDLRVGAPDWMPDHPAAAKAKGKYKGRAPATHAKAGQIRKLAAEGLRKAEIARRLGVGERSVYRMLAGQAPG